MSHQHTCSVPSTHANVLGHLSDQGQAVQCSLIDATHLIVNKQAGQEHCQGENLRAVLARL